MKVFPWLMRRELWENRFLYIVPLVLVSVLVLSYTWIVLLADVYIDSSEISLRQLIQENPDSPQVKVAAGGFPFILPLVLLNVVMLIMWFFYLTDSLYSERKDRSVLFWKSLPVNDMTTVLSKLVIAMAVIPALTLIGILIAAVGMTLANTLLAWTAGASAWQLVWSQLPFISGPVILLYALAVQSLWYAPVFGWLLLVSAWARRAPALWAILPPAGIALLEGAVLRSSRFAEIVGERLTPIVPTAYSHNETLVMEQIHRSDGQIDWSEAFGSLIDPGSFVSDPGLWGGLVVAAVFVTGAIWLRRYRGEL